MALSFAPLRQPSPEDVEPTPSRIRRLSCLAAYLVLGGLTLSPLLWVSVPPLVDYPNHLACVWIILHGAEIPALATNYFSHWLLFPNLATALVVPALAQVMPVELAGRLYVAMTMAFLVGGTITLHRVLHGRVGFWPLCSLLFVYNAVMFWGFLAFLFSTGLSLFAFSGWISTRKWPTTPRLALFAVVASILFVMHLFAFGIYAVSVVAYELGQHRPWRRISGRQIMSLVGTGLQFLPAGFLWLASLPNSGPEYIHYGNLANKLYAIEAPTTFGQEPVLLDSLTLLFCAVFLLFAVISRTFKLAPEMKVPLVVLALTAAFIPNWLSGSWGADFRLPVILPLLVIAGLRPIGGQPRAMACFALVGLALLCVRIWAVSASWRDDDRLFAEYRTASDVIPMGARLLIANTPLLRDNNAIPGIPRALAVRQDPTMQHMPALSVIDRSAFIPYLFTTWTTIRATPRNAGLFAPQGVPITSAMLVNSARPGSAESPESLQSNALGEAPYWLDWPKHFDFLLWVDFSGASAPESDLLQEVAKGSFFRIYRIVRPLP